MGDWWVPRGAHDYSQCDGWRKERKQHELDLHHGKPNCLLGLHTNHTFDISSHHNSVNILGLWWPISVWIGHRNPHTNEGSFSMHLLSQECNYRQIAKLSSSQWPFLVHFSQEIIIHPPVTRASGNNFSQHLSGDITFTPLEIESKMTNYSSPPKASTFSRNCTAVTIISDCGAFNHKHGIVSCTLHQVCNQTFNSFMP